MMQIKCNPQSIPTILDGTKYATWRLSGYDQAHVGTDVQLVNNQTNEVFAHATITQIIEKPFRLLTLEDRSGHEGYSSEERMYEVYSHYYNDRKVDANTPVRIIKFEVKSEVPAAEPAAIPAKLTEVKLFTDGGSRGNPGPSSSGFVLTDMDDTVIEKGGEYLGITTNNQAEYQAVKLGLETAKKLGVRKVHGHMDSLLVVNQMKGIFKIKNRELWPIHQAIQDLRDSFESVTFTHIPREMNKLADEQVNLILDAEESKNRIA